MVLTPLRNVYQFQKLCFTYLMIVSALVFVILSRQWTFRKPIAVPVHLDENETEWERQILEDEARIVPGMGENGAPFQLTDWQKQMSELDLKKFAVNVYLSERISYNRTIKDYRHPHCRELTYDAELPSTTVILPIHNEIYSVVIRMLWSIINSVRRDNPIYQNANTIDKTGNIMQLGYKGQSTDSQLLYIKEIILVDDKSTLVDLKGKLSYYVKTRLPKGLVKIVRLPKRVGLIRAKVEGARFATGEALVFLDAHCEVQPDWLRPLLQNLKENSTYVLYPIIDTICPPDFSYSVGGDRLFQVGGFAVHGSFAFLDVSEREKKRRGSDIALTLSPTMAGGLFAIRRSYFWDMGAYDEQMLGWGGENLEMSFRIWQCGGTIATVPCSRVGHLFHPFHPFSMPRSLDTYGVNTARMAEVWMDEYAEAFYLYRPELRNDPKVGNVTDRQLLRKKLKCKSFRWYLDNVYQEKYVPGADSVAFGRFLSPLTGACLHNVQEMTKPYPLIATMCERRLIYSQFLSLTLQGQIRDEYNCLFVKHGRRNLTNLSSCQQTTMVAKFADCQSYLKEQKWRYIPETRQLLNLHTKLCLKTPRKLASDVMVTRCNESEKEQIWYIEFSDASFKYKYTIEPESEIQMQRLTKLTGHKMVRIDIPKYSQVMSQNLDVDFLDS